MNLIGGNLCMNLTYGGITNILPQDRTHLLNLSESHPYYSSLH